MDKIMYSLIKMTGSMLFILILAILLLPACGSPGMAHTYHNPGPNPLALETVYFEELTDTIVSTSISFRNPTRKKYKHSENNLAVCFTSLDYVKVNPKRFHTLGTRQRIVLTAHEILHCQYGLDHLDDSLSVMNSNIPSEVVLEKNWLKIAA